MDKAGRSVLALVVLAIFSGVAFLNFYRSNWESLPGPGRLIGCYLVVLAIVVAVSLLARTALRGVPLFRIFMVVAAAVFMLFCYNEIKQLLGSESVVLAMACWGCATILACVAVAKLSTRAALLPTMTIIGVAYLTPAAVGLVNAGRPVHERIPARLALTARNPRNVYWILLDGYPRADVLEQFFDFDNSAFLGNLRDLGFVVYDSAQASFPETIFSVSSTLSLGFLSEGEPPGKIWPPADLYPIVRGQSVVIDTIRAMGYEYIHFQNGYDNLTQCPLRQAICIRGNAASSQWFDEFDVALWSKTPLIDLIAHSSAGLAVDETPFLRGAVHDLTGRLAEVQAQRAPFFLYGHILAPHPPIRFKRDCSTRNAAPDLLRWDPDDKPAFLDQLVCVNSETTDLVGRIVKSDPEAIIVVQSDHGTAFRGQFRKPFDAWDRLDLKERFGALNAIRMPASCADDIRGNVDLVNTFARVLNCIAGSRLPDQESRQFVVSHADMASFHEYTGHF